jgi:hypothetical protein
MSKNKLRIERIEREITSDLGKMPPQLGLLLKSVIFPQLKSVPDAAEADMREAVRHIVRTLEEVFEL